MKKILSFLLIATFVFGFSACSSDNEEATVTTTAPATTAIVTEEATTVAITEATVEAMPSEFASGDFTAKYADGRIALFDYSGKSEGKGVGYELIVPAEVEGYPVTEIGEYCFELSITVGKVVLPEGVEKIGRGAFKNAWKLSAIELPEGLTTIEASAFEGCMELTEVTVPSSVTTIGEKAFDAGVTIKCTAGSAAEEYAKANGNTYVTE